MTTHEPAVRVVGLCKELMAGPCQLENASMRRAAKQRLSAGEGERLVGILGVRAGAATPFDRLQHAGHRGLERPVVEKAQCAVQVLAAMRTIPDLGDQAEMDHVRKEQIVAADRQEDQVIARVDRLAARVAATSSLSSRPPSGSIDRTERLALITVLQARHATQRESPRPERLPALRQTDERGQRAEPVGRCPGPISRSCSCSTTSMRCSSRRPSQSSRHTTSVSPAARNLRQG